jgi:CRISPR-associated protein Cmr3
MTTILELTCRDPIVSRDGRPFGAGQGNRMRSAGWPIPSVVAGSLRTAVGKAAGRDLSAATEQELQELLQVAVAGVLPAADGLLYLPAPRDCVVHPEHGSLRATPQTFDEGGCDWPAEGLRPVMLAEDQAKDDFKPKDGPAWWPVDRYAGWLAGQTVTFGPSFLNSPAREDRTHVRLDADTGAADEGNLFTTAALPLTHLARYGMSHDIAFRERFAEIRLTARVRANGWCGETVARLDTLHPLGGERRLVHWRTTASGVWTCPEAVASSLTMTQRVRMALATPAIFRGGWKPGWLGNELTGTPPGTDLTLKLVGASIQRWRAASGWSLAKLSNQPRGPKPVKRMVPAGGVYFFEVVNGTAAALKTRWLEPVSDDAQDRGDGFGLAAWGVW